MLADAQTASLRWRLWLVLIALGVFLTVFWAHGWTVRRFGSDLPYWDQWDAEGTNLLLPWKSGHLSWRDFYHPQNEHRVVLTKLFVLGLVAGGGQWDARVQLFFNAGLYATIAVGAYYWLTSFLRTKGQVFAWTTAVLVGFALPHSLENTLSGFHSQQYFLIGVSLFAIDRTLRCREGSGGWWAGLFAMGLALFTMGSGLLAAAAGMIMALVVPSISGQKTLTRWRTLAACGLVCLVGVAIIEPAPHHASLHAHTFEEFYETFRRAMAWPLPESWLFFVVSFAPIVLLMISSLRRRLPSDAKEWVLLAAGGWIVMQLVATGYARGAGGLNPSTRYLDTLVVSLAVNFAAGLVLWVQRPLNWAYGGCLLLLLTVWTGAVGFGLWSHQRALVGYFFPERIGTLKACEHNVRLYLFTGDVAWLKRSDIPYPDTDALIERLGHQELRDLMPASVRAPQALTGVEGTGFTEGATSKACTPFLFAAARGSYPASRTGSWSSAPIRPDRTGYLKFELAGDTDARDVALELRSSQGDRLLETVRPSKRAGDRWRAAYVPIPHEPFRVVAHDGDRNAWLAFTDPVYMSRLSYLCWRWLEHAPLFCWFGVVWVVAVLAIGCAFPLHADKWEV